MSKSYLILPFSGKTPTFFLLFGGNIPTFSYFLMKIPTFSYFFDLSYYLTPCITDEYVGVEDAVNVTEREQTPQEEADEVIKEADNAKARMLNIPVELNKIINISVIDQDYQMIDGHVEESIRKKIINFEYVNFSKLLPTHRSARDDDAGQRLEIVNRDGQSFLSPVSERKRVRSHHLQKGTGF